MTSHSSWKSYLSHNEVEFYTHLFNLAKKSQPNTVTGLEAVQFFAKAGLSNDILSQIWDKADEDNLGYLTLDTFAVALKLIACAQNHISATEPLFATVTPLPRIQGAESSEPAMVITPAERQKYQSIYQAQKPGANGLGAQAVQNLLSKSRLPNEKLAQIWNLANIRGTESLNETEFIIAMHYVAHSMDKSIQTLPSVLPHEVYLSANPVSTVAVASPRAMSPLLQSRAKTIDSIGDMAFGSSPPARVEWDITAAEKAKYDSFFFSIDKNKQGVIQYTDAIKFFKNSELSDSEIDKIFQLSDIRKSYTLNPNEFAISMHLIHSRLRGEHLPDVLPPKLMPPPPPRHVGFSPVQFGNQQRVEPDDDLLGEDNEQLTNETNNVNLLQNQIRSTRKATEDIQAQQKFYTESLDTLKSNKSGTQTDLQNLKEEIKEKEKEIDNIKETIQKESALWNETKQASENGEKDLELVRQEIQKLSDELKAGLAENEKLRRSVHNVQMESNRYTKELDELHALYKKKQEAAAVRRAAKAEAARLAEEERLKKEEEERLKREEEERLKKEEEERLKREEEERLKKEEEERLKKEEEERLKKEEEERLKKEEEERLKKEEEERLKKEEEERLKKEEEERLKKEEEERLKKDEEERLKKEEEERLKKEEEERLKKEEEERLKKEEEERLKNEEEERLKKEEEERLKREEEDRLKKEEEEYLKKEEEERLKKEEEERLKNEEEERLKKEEEERLKREEEDRLKKEEEEYLKKEEEERLKKEEEDRLKKEEEGRLKKEEEGRLKKEEEERLKKEEEERLKKEEEERLKKEEQDRLKKEEEERLKKKEEEERLKKEEEERLKREEEDRLKKEEEKRLKKQEEEERLKKEEEERLKREEEERLQKEKEVNLSEKNINEGDDHSVGIIPQMLEVEQGNQIHETVDKLSNGTDKFQKAQNIVNSDTADVAVPELIEEDQSKNKPLVNKKEERDADNDKELLSKEKAEQPSIVSSKEPVSRQGLDADGDKYALNSSNLQDSLSKHNSATTDDDEGNASDNFFDAVEATPSTPKNEVSSDENEFVMIQHPATNSTSSSTSTNNITMSKNFSQNINPTSKKNEQQETISPFDAVFGNFDTAAPQLDITNPFSTTDMNIVSKTKTPPPPPQSRKVKREMAATATAASSVASEPSAVEPKNTDTASHKTPTTTTTEDEFETYFSDPKFAGSANNGGNEQETTPEPKQNEAEKQEGKLATPSTAVGEDKKKKKKKGLKIVPGKKNIVSWAKNFGSFDFSGMDSDNKKEDKGKHTNKHASSETSKRTVSKRNSTNESSSAPQKTSPKPVLASVEEPVSTPVSTAPPVFDLDTIQGSHIAELVNMGFDPAAAKDALDRYDQDVEKATNFLLDQFN